MDKSEYQSKWHYLENHVVKEPCKQRTSCKYILFAFELDLEVNNFFARLCYYLCFFVMKSVSLWTHSLDPSLSLINHFLIQNILSPFLMQSNLPIRNFLVIDQLFTNANLFTIYQVNWHMVTGKGICRVPHVGIAHSTCWSGCYGLRILSLFLIHSNMLER